MEVTGIETLNPNVCVHFLIIALIGLLEGSFFQNFTKFVYTLPAKPLLYIRFKYYSQAVVRNRLAVYCELYRYQSIPETSSPFRRSASLESFRRGSRSPLVLLEHGIRNTIIIL